MSTRISQKGMLLKYMMVYNTDRSLHVYILSACVVQCGSLSEGSATLNFRRRDSGILA